MQFELNAGLLVYVRIALYVIAGRLVAGGWLPPELVPEFVSPVVVEMVAGVLVAGVALVWYWFSRARAVLAKAVTGVSGGVAIQAKQPPSATGGSPPFHHPTTPPPASK
jgi:hypothetical protein